MVESLSWLDSYNIKGQKYIFEAGLKNYEWPLLAWAFLR